MLYITFSGFVRMTTEANVEKDRGGRFLHAKVDTEANAEWEHNIHGGGNSGCGYMLLII